MSDVAKSIGDFLLEVLSDLRKFFMFLFLIACVTGIVLGSGFLVFRYMPSRTSQIKLGSASFVFSQSTSEGNEYMVLIAPQGWQKTDIPVRQGEELQIIAGGRVYTDLMRLNRALAKRLEAEERVERDIKAGKLRTQGPIAPEDYFTQAEKKAMTPKYPSWTGPDGLSDMRDANPVRMKRSIDPELPYGTLVAFIGEKDDPSQDRKFRPPVKEVLRIGSGRTFTAPANGYLYFAVNDVQDNDNPAFPGMFTIDNIGSFYAKVTIRR